MAIIAKGTMKKDDKAANQQQNQPVSPTVGAAPVGSAQQGMGSAQPNQQKTNIQSFTAANKEGTERIGSALKTGLNRDVNVQNQATEQSIQNVRNAVEQANKNATLGQQFLNQVKTPTAGTWSGQAAPQPQQPMAPRQTQPTAPVAGKISMDPAGDINLQPVPGAANTRPVYTDKGFTDTVFDAEALAKDEEKAKQFQGIRTGETLAADKKAQEQAAATALAQKEAYNKFTQDRLNQLRNNQASGQDALLQDYLGKYMQNYTKGQSALDKSLLRLDQNNTLSKAKQDLKQRQATDVAQAGSKIDQQKQAIAANLESTKTLKDDLQNAITQKVQEYESLVGNDERLANANKFRADEIAYLEDQLDKLSKNDAIQKNFADEIGLKSSDVVYKGLQEELGNLYQVDRENLTSANQVATGSERAKIAALYKLAGFDPSSQKIDINGEQTIDPTKLIGNIGGALTRAEENFLAKAADKKIFGDSYTGISGNPDWMYGFYTNKDKSVKDYISDLAGRQVDTYNSVNSGNVDKKFAGYTAYNPYIDRFSTWNEDSGQAVVHSNNGQNSGVSQAAMDKGQELAIEDLTKDLNEFLSQQGRFNRVKYE